MQKKLNLAKLEEAFGRGQSLRTVRGIPKSALQALYAVAYGLYQQEQFAQAERVFALLCVYDHFEPRYLQGLAASRKALGAYESAAQTWGLLMAVTPQDPIPWLMAADCRLALGEYEAARFGLTEALRRSWHCRGRERAEALLEHVLQHIIEQKKETSA